MDLRETFKHNILKEFPDIECHKKHWGNGKIATVACSPFRKREDLQNIFSFFLSGIDVLLVSGEQASKMGELFWQESQRREDWGRILILTSGTSGTPQIIVHSLDELLKSSQATLNFYKVDSQDVWPLSLPLYHVGGLQIALRCLLAGIPLEPLDERFYRLGENFKATLLSLVPLQLSGLLTNPKNWSVMRQMKAILVGGAPLSEEIWWEAVEKKIPLSPTYGLTEMGSQVAAINPQDFLQGKSDLEILPGRKIEIYDEKVVLSGIGQMQGFFENGFLVKNNKKIITQDKGVLKKGRLKILGRWDRVIISGGKKIYPQPLESLLAQHSAITEAVLVGLPDDKWGEKLHLAYTGCPGLNLDDIKSFLRPHAAPWEIPKGISHCHFLPKKGVCKPDHGQIVGLVQ